MINIGFDRSTLKLHTVMTANGSSSFEDDTLVTQINASKVQSFSHQVTAIDVDVYISIHCANVNLKNPSLTGARKGRDIRWL